MEKRQANSRWYLENSTECMWSDLHLEEEDVVTEKIVKNFEIKAGDKTYQISRKGLKLKVIETHSTLVQKEIPKAPSNVLTNEEELNLQKHQQTHYNLTTITDRQLSKEAADLLKYERTTNSQEFFDHLNEINHPTKVTVTLPPYIDWSRENQKYLQNAIIALGNNDPLKAIRQFSHIILKKRNEPNPTTDQRTEA